MDEKVIISSDSRNVKGVITRILVYGLVLAVAAALAAFVMRLFDEFWALTGVVVYVIVLCIAFAVWCIGTCSITVTTKRVYSMAKFKKRIDIPLDSVTSIGMVGLLFKGISISSPSGNISFVFIKNYKDIYDKLGNIIANRKTSESTDSDQADDIRKYKKLLDDGIITQEEFEAKKKELLGM